MDILDSPRDNARDRDRSRRGDKPSRFSDGNRDRDRSTDRGRRASSNRVYLSNISYEYSWQDLKDLFRKMVGDVKFVEIFVDENEKPKGCGIVEFHEPSMVKKCLEVMHKYDLKGRKLIVKEDAGNERDKHGNILNGRGRGRDREESRDRRDRGGMRSDMNNMFNRGVADESKIGPTWGLSPQFLESLGINRPLVNRIFVANLDYKVDEKKLREIFKLAGKVVDVELYHDKEGKSRGCALVEYDHPVESVQAISMFHDQYLMDRQMAVRMDRMEDGPVRMPDGLRNMGMGLGPSGEPLRNVSLHLRTTNDNVSGVGGGASAGGPGILGAVPNSSLPNLGALSNVVNTPALAALQGLTGVQNQFLHANNLNDLNLANLNPSLVANSLGGNAALSALANQQMSGQSMGSSGMMGQGSMGSYGRGDGNSMGLHSLGQGMNRDYNNIGNRSDYDQQSGRASDYGMKGENDYRDDFRQSSALYTSVNNGAQRPSLMSLKDTNYSSDTVIVNNLSATVSWKMLREKFSCCGDVQYVETKSKDTALVRFSNPREADKAIQLFDRARIDGRTIEVRLF